MATPMSAAATISAGLDSLVQIATLLVGGQQAAEDLVRQTVLHSLPNWRLITGDPEQQLRLMMARRSVHRHPTRSAAGLDPIFSALAALSPRQRAIVVLKLVADQQDATLAEGLHHSETDVHHSADRGLAKLRSLVADPAHLDEQLWQAVCHLRSTPELRSELLEAAASADPVRRELLPDKESRRLCRPKVVKLALALAAVVLVAMIPVARLIVADGSAPSVSSDSGADSGAEPDSGSSARTPVRITPSPEWRAEPAEQQAPEVTAEACRKQSIKLGRAASTEVTGGRIIGLCWVIETGSGSVWAVGRSTGPSTALAAMADSRYYPPQKCRSLIPIRPVLVSPLDHDPEDRPEGSGSGVDISTDPDVAASFGCLPADDLAAVKSLGDAVRSLQWSITEPNVRCDPRVSNGLAYQPYGVISDEAWDLGVLCVDSGDLGGDTAFAVVTADRLAAARTIADLWSSSQTLGFCSTTAAKYPRVALWLAKTSALGQFQGVFGPNACPVSEQMVSMFRMLTDPAKRQLAVPDLTGKSIDSALAALRASGFAR